MLPVKKKPLYYLSCLPIALLLIACGQSAEEINDLLAQAVQRVEQQPDSALHYLNAIQNPARLNKAQYGDYHLLRVQAKDRAGHDISADTVICEVKDYFLQKKEVAKATLAAFYEGHVFAAGKDDRRAIKAFLEAGNMAGRLTDNKRKGLIQYNIGYLYYNRGTDYDKAVDHFKQAFAHFQAGNHYKYSIEALNLVGTCFLLQARADSALFYQQQALAIAEVHADTAAQAKVLQNISVTCREMGNTQQAKQYALRAAGFDNTGEAAVGSLLNLAYIYYDCAQYDSAAFYAHRIQQLCEKDVTLSPPASFYALLTNIAKQNNDYKEALIYHEKYTEQIFEIYKEKERQSVAGIQEKYALEVAENKNHQLLIHRLWLLIIASLVALFLFGSLFLWYNWHCRQKIKLLKMMQENTTLHSSHIDFYKKAGILKQSLSAIVHDENLLTKINHKITQIIYNAHDVHTWEGLYPALNKQYNGLFDRLRQKFPQLDDTKFRICCLDYAGFRNKEIAEYVQLKPNTVQAKKNAIRKALGIPPKGDIKKFLAHFMDEDE
jgi:tetratricopeptide (TPR) repeat protein